MRNECFLTYEYQMNPYVCMSTTTSFPICQVREFGVEDACPYMVEFRWDRDGEQSVQALFEKNSPFPSTKSLTLMRSHPFKVVGYVPELNSKIGEYEVSRSWSTDSYLKSVFNLNVLRQIGPFEVPPTAEKAKIKIKIRMNLHGLVQFEGVDNFVELEEEVST